jgi:hypothetical protein
MNSEFEHIDKSSVNPPVPKRKRKKVFGADED